VAVTGLAVLLLVPQVVFLADTPPEGRYLYPVAFLACGAWGSAFWALSKTPPWCAAAGTMLLLVAVAAPITAAVHQTRGDATAAAVETRAFQARMDAISRATERAGATRVVLQPHAPSDIEPVASIATYLTQRHGLTVMTVPAPAADDPFAVELNAELRSWSTDGFALVHLRPYRAGGDCVSVMIGQGGVPLCPAVAVPAP
jgi:hypothetical protein